MSSILDVLIIGSGPAGYTAAIYSARANLNPVLITGTEVGGQLSTTPEVGNWPGVKDNPAGSVVMDSLKDHALSLGTKFVYDNVVSVDFSSDIKTVTLSSNEVLKTRTVIICTGAKARYLGLDSEHKYKGKGVSACATCDGFFFRKKDVAVIGGGSAAFVEAIFLASICNKVYLIHRREGFRAEKVLIDKVKALVNDGKIELVLNATVDEIIGDENRVTSIKVDIKSEKRIIDLQGVFVAIGHSPATNIFNGQIELDNEGYIKVGYERETQCSVKGIFAAGDCVDKIYRQAITSAGTGCKAALDAEHYLL